MGKHIFTSTDEFHQKAVQVGLKGRKSERDTVKPGQVTVIITQSRDIMAV